LHISRLPGKDSANLGDFAVVMHELGLGETSTQFFEALDNSHGDGDQRQHGQRQLRRFLFLWLVVPSS